jgi:hypothetical protein
MRISHKNLNIKKEAIIRIKKAITSMTMRAFNLFMILFQTTSIIITKEKSSNLIKLTGCVSFLKSDIFF